MRVPSSIDEAPQEIRVLFAQAREGNLTPIDFCKALNPYVTSRAQKMLYIRDAFGLPLEQAKRVLIKAEYGSTETWGEEMGRVVDELSTDFDGSKDINELESATKRDEPA